MPYEHQQTTSLLGAGSLPQHFYPKLAEAIAQLSISNRILATGIAEFNRATTVDGPAFQIEGAVDLSPGQDEQRHAAGFLGDAEIAAMHRADWESVNHAMIDRLIRTLQEANLTDALTIWTQSMSSGHTTAGEVALQDLATRRPADLILSLTVLPDEAYLRDAVRHDYSRFVRLKDAGVLAVTHLADNRAPLALTVGLELQDRYIACGFATAMAASAHFPNQRGFADIVHALDRYGAWIGSAYASRNIVAANPVRWWEPIRRPFGLPQRARGATEDIEIAIRTAVTTILSDATTQAIDEPIDLAKQSFLALTVPLKRDDPRWTRLAPAIKEWLAREYPAMTPVFASGNGVADRRFTSAYWVQASLFYPLPDVPRPIQQILESQPLQRRVPAVVSEHANGKRGESAGSISAPELTISRRA